MCVTAQTNVKKMAGFRSSVNTADCPLDFPSPGLAPISGFEMRGRSTVPIWEGCVHPRGVGSGMENLSFKDIKVVVGDPNRGVRDGIRGGLYGQGFRYIMITDRMSVVEIAVATNEVDLLICDVELPDGDLYDLTYRIRHHELGDNPFIVVTALITAPTLQMVKRVFDSGCDDLVPKPISTGLLFERVVNLTRNRKRFVVTSDYIGPNRRARPRPGTQQILLIEVPNPLNAKATGDVNVDDLQRDIERVAEVLNQQKMERHASGGRDIVSGQEAG